MTENLSVIFCFYKTCFDSYCLITCLEDEDFASYQNNFPHLKLIVGCLPSCVPVFLSQCYDRRPDRGSSKTESLFGFTFSGFSHHGRKSQDRSQMCLQSGKRERQILNLLSTFQLIWNLFGMGPLTFRVSLSTSVKTL